MDCCCQEGCVQRGKERTELHSDGKREKEEEEEEREKAVSEIQEIPCVQEKKQLNIYYCLSKSAEKSTEISYYRVFVFSLGQEQQLFLCCAQARRRLGAVV